MEGTDNARVALGELSERAAVHHELLPGRRGCESAATQEARDSLDA